MTDLKPQLTFNSKNLIRKCFECIVDSSGSGVPVATLRGLHNKET